MSNEKDKKTAKIIQARLKELGYDVKLGHAYELLAALYGDKSWNVASAKSKVETLSASYPLSESYSEVKSNGDNEYEVIVSSTAILKKSLKINADSPFEARKRAMEYIDDNEDYCCDSGEGWSFERIGDRNGGYMVTEIHQYLAEGNVSNSVEVEPDWDLNDCIYGDKRELEEDFKNQVAEFKSEKE